MICLVCLVTYFLANRYLIGNEQQVLDTTSVKGVWVSTVGSNTCPESSLVDTSGCIDESYFNEYRELDTYRISLDDSGKIIFSNDELFVNGSFEIKESIDSEIWDMGYIGDFTLKINERNWVFKDLVWKDGSNENILGITELNDGYLISFSPSVSLNTLFKQLWMFKYSKSTDSVEQFFFTEGDSKNVFIDSTYVSVLEESDRLFIRVDLLNPSLVGSREVILYEYVDNGLDFVKNYILKTD